MKTFIKWNIYKTTKLILIFYLLLKFELFLQKKKKKLRGFFILNMSKILIDDCAVYDKTMDGSEDNNFFDVIICFSNETHCSPIFIQPVFKNAKFSFKFGK